MAETKTHEVLIDTHTHSNKYAWVSENIAHTPTDSVAQVAYRRALAFEEGISPERNLGGIALTDHDTVAGASEALEAAEKYDVVIIPGVEVTCKISRKGFGPHVIVLLPKEEALQLQAKQKKKLKPTLHSVGYVIEWAHDHGGLAIGAHPLKGGGITSLSNKKLEKHAQAPRAERQLDGWESMFPYGMADPGNLRKLARLAIKHDKAQFGSSDAHATLDIGSCATRIWGLPENFDSDDVLEAMRRGQTEPVFLRQPREQVMKAGFRSLVDSRKNIADMDEARNLRALQQFKHDYERMAA